MKIYQIMDALDYGDAVSNHCIELSLIMDKSNIENYIYTKYTHDKVKELTQSIESLVVTKTDIVIFHFSGKSILINHVKKLQCKKILLYHNITPHHFFEGMEPHYTHCLEGRKQLNQLVGQFDYYVGDSEFNVEELANLHCEPSSVLPIVVDLAVKKQPNKKLDKEGAKFLFVGRVAPNKKHEDIIKVFNYYYTYIDPKATLYLVGDYNNYTLYYEKLLKLQGTLPCKNNVIFTGKVSGEELDFHYRTSDVLLCMSEHEGFCVPLLESMSYGIPTIAFDAGAIRSTMGIAGVKIIEKEYENIAELISYILGNDDLKNSLVNKQYEWLEQFTVEKTAEALIQIISRVEKL